MRLTAFGSFAHPPVQVFESLLTSPRDITLISQVNQVGKDDQPFPEGLDLGTAFKLITVSRDEARAERVELVSGTSKEGEWKEASAASLAPMFRKWREIYAEQLTKRFMLDTTPDEFTLLAMKMNPSINTELDGPELTGKQAKAETMKGVYMRALRKQGILLAQQRKPAPTVIAGF